MKKPYKMLIIGVCAVFVVSVIGQFGYNFSVCQTLRA